MLNTSRKVAIIGGGAAGFFAAIHLAEAGIETHIFEKDRQILRKVSISGGGRCNVLPACYELDQLASHYPRGRYFLRKLFHHFSSRDSYKWFEQRGVRLKTEADGRVFPATNSSKTIVDCLLKNAIVAGVHVHTSCPIQSIEPYRGGWRLYNPKIEYSFDAVLVASGGNHHIKHYQWLASIGIPIISPVPSLFTFNLPGATALQALQGISLKKAIVRLPALRLETQGPILITHWGLSGPAILWLSAWGARQLYEQNYRSPVQVNWLGLPSRQAIDKLKETQQNEQGKYLKNTPLGLPQRLWLYLLQKAEINGNITWKRLKKQQLHLLHQAISSDMYEINGKTTFKEEFVSCGGVSLQAVHANTLMSKMHPGLFFAGEVLDIDGLTGGFNFQAAWTTAFVAARGIQQYLQNI